MSGVQPMHMLLFGDSVDYRVARHLCNVSKHEEILEPFGSDPIGQEHNMTGTSPQELAAPASDLEGPLWCGVVLGLCKRVSGMAMEPFQVTMAIRCPTNALALLPGALDFSGCGHHRHSLAFQVGARTSCVEPNLRLSASSSY